MKTYNTSTAERTLEKQRLLSADVLRATFSYEPLTGKLIRRLNAGRGKAGDVVGNSNGRGHLSACINYRKYLVHRLVWLHVHGEWPDGEIDHKNGRGEDNRIENLRECSHHQNAGNLKARNRDLPKGVTLVKDKRCNRRAPYVSRIKINGKTISLGCFRTAESAHSAYKVAAQKYFGEFARAA